MQENMRTLQGDAAFLQVSLSHQQEVGARLESYISESQASLEKSKQQAEVRRSSQSYPEPYFKIHGASLLIL